MGYIPDIRIEHDFRSQGDKYVCIECFGDYAIQEFIEKFAESKKCDYCKKSSKKHNIAANINDVILFILEGVETEWGDPNNEGVGWDSGEGGYYSAVVIYSYDLFTEELDLGIEREELLSDIIDAFSDDMWCQKDPHGLLPQDQWYIDWERFCHLVKHHTRYVFFRIPKEENFDPCQNKPYEILDEIGVLVNDLHLIKTLPENSVFVRVRCHEEGEKLSDVKALGPPPVDKANNSNRMSPAGIPMFYGSIDQETALAETYDKRPYATIAKFKTLKSFKVLDLTELASIPSLFDNELRWLRPGIIFLHSFLEDFTKPIERDGREHIEYVPTQIVTEFFRRIFLDEEGDPIKGIIYPSAREIGGKSCVLFFQSEDCIQDNVDPENKQDKWLSMLSKSKKTIKLP